MKSPVLWAVCLLAAAGAPSLPILKASAAESTPAQLSATPVASASADTAQASTNTVAQAKPSTPASAPTTQANDLLVRIQSAATNPSPAVAAVVKMAESGVEPAVLEAYARNANVGSLTAEEILYLHHAGIASQVITALIQRGGELRAQQAQSSRAAQSNLEPQTPAPGTAVAPQVVPPPPAPLPNNYYVTTPPIYDYASPSYAYAYASYPFFTYSYPWPFYYGIYFSSFRYPGHHVGRPVFYGTRPHSSFRTGFTPHYGSPSFPSPVTRIGHTPGANPVHSGGHRFGR